MRPLTDLTPLPQSPSVFSHPTDDWNAIFSSEFAGADANQAALDGGTNNVYAAMDPISSAIDALSGALDAAGAVLDLLSGDLDLVDLTPEIINYQSLDNSLDSNLSSVSFDFTGAITSFITAVENIVAPLINALIAFVESIASELFNALSSVFSTFTAQLDNVSNLALP